MSFDFNNWYDKGRNATNEEEKEYYWSLGEKAIRDLLDERKDFYEFYDDPQYKCSINEEYLTQILPELLTGDVYIPPMLLSYIREKCDLPTNTIAGLYKIYIQKGWERSAYGSGLKMIEAGADFVGVTKVVMFELYEFTLTYPEYDDLFVEEWI